VSKHLLLLTDIARAIGEAKTLPDALHSVVSIIADEMNVDVCSIWLLEPAGDELRLAATKGLRREGVGQRLERGAGLTWQVLERNGPVVCRDVADDPHFIYIPAMHEEAFHSYLGLPLLLRGEPIGALYVQTRIARSYSDDEVRALLAIASQVAPVVENARLLRTVTKAGDQPARAAGAGAKRAHGTPCSSGIVCGEVVVLGGAPSAPPRRRRSIEEELEQLTHACDGARKELQDMQAWLRERNAEEAALVFTVQLMLLEDDSFEGRMREAIEDGRSTHDAIVGVSEQVRERFRGLDNPYFREREDDVRDLGARLLRHVAGKLGRKALSLRGKVAVLPWLSPSRIVSLCAEGVGAVLTGGGGATSHAALLARSLDLPAVVGLGDFVNHVAAGDRVLVDAASGEVVVDPPDDVVKELTRAASAGVAALHKLEHEDPGGGAEGRIRFEANVSLWGDTIRARDEGAEGIGLYRTEFAFLMRPDLPGEEEQKALYRRVVETVAPLPVTFRLLDAGGDKLVPALAQKAEPNPFLGYRSLRLLLDHPEIVRAQARAIFHALEGTDGRLLVPMVTSLEEYRAIRKLLETETDKLPPMGIMIEVPSALLQLRELADAGDFLCVGTNDLVQYLLGVDRTNERVTRFFDPCHPAVVRALHAVAQMASAAGKPLSICGEMASSPLLLPLWIGLGIERLSVHATRLRALRSIEARIDTEAARAVVAKALELGTAAEVRKCFESLATPEVLEFVRIRKGV
jgi:phosphotransferase system enzyme I (PtsP)